MKSFFKKTSKILFWLCFLPYAFILVNGIYHAIVGYENRAFVTGDIISTYYGMDAFLESVTVSYLFLLYFGIIPACAVYQVVYFIATLYFNNKNKNRD